LDRWFAVQTADRTEKTAIPSAGTQSFLRRNQRAHDCLSAISARIPLIPPSHFLQQTALLAISMQASTPSIELSEKGAGLWNGSPVAEKIARFRARC